MRVARASGNPDKLQDRELARAGLTAADVSALLRQQGVDDLGQVESRLASASSSGLRGGRAIRAEAGSR